MSPPCTTVLHAITDRKDLEPEIKNAIEAINQRLRDPA